MHFYPHIHPKYYPPTLFAINEFSKIAGEVTVITRNLANSEWKFPENVNVKTSGKYISLEESMKLPYLMKIKSFFEYITLLYRRVKTENPDLVVVYDPIALFATWALTKLMSKKHIFWYHNHDVIDKSMVGKFSIGWFAIKYEKKAFNSIDIFTLPSDERKNYFPIKEGRGKYYFLPNLPAMSFYKQFYRIKHKPEKEIKLLYQGVIRQGHGLEEIIAVLNHIVLNKSISLTLLGDIKADYKQSLINLASSYNVLDKLKILPREPYAKLPLTTAQYSTGLAIHNVKSIQYSTGGTATNKIYEYAALGLPVILYDCEHYRKYLDRFRWANFTDLSKGSIIACIQNIIENYCELSNLAHHDFLNELNFERKFKKILDNALE